MPAVGAWDEPLAAAWVQWCWGALKASLPGLINYTANGFILSSPCPCEAVAARNPAVTLPLHPHPSAEPFLSLLLVLTEIDFSLDLQVQW